MRELYTPADLPEGIGGPRRPDRPPRRVSLHARASTARCTAAGCGRCASSPASAPRGDQRALPLPARARPDRPFDGVRHAVPDGPRLRPPALARRGRARGRRRRHARRHADAVRRDRPRRGLGVDDDQRTGRDHARLLRRGRRDATPCTRPRPERLSGTIQTDILKEYIAQKEWCFPIDPAMRLCGDMIEWCTAPDAALAPDLDLRLPHPRGRVDRPAGARVHAQGRAHLRRAGRRSGAWTSTTSRRGCRSSSTRRSTSSRRSPSTGRRAASGRARCASASARKSPRSWQMRFHTQTAGVSLTAQQPLNNIVRTAVEALAGGARRHAVAAHELLRRGARAADRGGRHDRAAHAADHRPRDGRHEHGRPARRLLLRGGPDRRDGAQGLRVLRQDRRARRDGAGGQAELPAARDRRRGLRAAAGDRRRRAHRRRRQPLPGLRRRADPDAARRPRARGQADRAAAGRARQARRRRGRARARRAAGGRRPSRAQPHGRAARRAHAPTPARARSSRPCSRCLAVTRRIRSSRRRRFRFARIARGQRVFSR